MDCGLSKLKFWITVSKIIAPFFAKTFFPLFNNSNGIDTFVGERGVQLSGGQRQRIGIARALYKQADILVLDEATSALDNDTEYQVMKELSGLKKDLTVLIIAHRLSTLKGCDKIIKLHNNGSVDVGEYDEMINS